MVIYRSKLPLERPNVDFYFIPVLMKAQTLCNIAHQYLLNLASMVTKFEKVFFTLVICFVALTAIFWKEAKQVLGGTNTVEKEKLTKTGGSKKKDKWDEADNTTAGLPGIAIIKRWELPEELTEISAISYLDNQRIACIQDEEGSIYVYNINTDKIERKVLFAGVGDYEGMTFVNEVAYVVNSSGVIYEVSNLQGEKPNVKEHKTFLDSKNDVEGIGWDKNRKKLLVTVKNDNVDGAKGIYAFDPVTKQMSKDPAITLDLNNQMFSRSGKKKKADFQPSSIYIHRTLGDIYLLEGSNQRLLILDNNGNPQQLVQLNKKDFLQPEGITFSPEGDMFISNEGKSGKGNILKVMLN